MAGEVTVEEALDALTDSEYELETSESEHLLPDMRLVGRKYEERSRDFLDRILLRKEKTWNKSVLFEKWEVDEALETMYELTAFWADDHGYDVSVDRTDVFEQPIDEELLMNIEGSISIGDKDIGFEYVCGFPRTEKDKTSTKMEFKYGRIGSDREDKYDRFDASMSEEFRELYSLSESVLEQFGTVAYREPKL